MKRKNNSIIVYSLYCLSYLILISFCLFAWALYYKVVASLALTSGKPCSHSESTQVEGVCLILIIKKPTAAWTPHSEKRCSFSDILVKVSHLKLNVLKCTSIAISNIAHSTTINNVMLSGLSSYRAEILPSKIPTDGKSASIQPRTSLLKFDDLARSQVRYRILHQSAAKFLRPAAPEKLAGDVRHDVSVFESRCTRCT